MREKFGGCVDDLSAVLHRFLGLVGLDHLVGVFGILQLVAADSQRTVRAEGITELRPYRIVDRDVAAFGRGS